MKTKIIVLIALAWMAGSCGEDGTQTVKTGGRYKIDLPASMQEATGLNESASLQYQDIYEQLFIIVIDEPKSQMDIALEQNNLYEAYSNNLDSYARLITENMKLALGRNDSIPLPKTLKINGLNTRLFTFEATSSGEKIFWELAFVEGNNRYYQIMAWTLAANRDKLDGKMMAMINSFRETDKSIKQ